jgi:hypothetical protein
MTDPKPHKAIVVPICHRCGTEWAVEWYYSGSGFWCHNCKCWVAYTGDTQTIPPMPEESKDDQE